MSSKRVTVLLLSAATCHACLHICDALCLQLLIAWKCLVLKLEANSVERCASSEDRV